MKATIFFVHLTEPQRTELNELGWDSCIGKAYLAARDGKIDGMNFNLFVKAATFEFADNSEYVWVYLQNWVDPWTADKHIMAHITHARSMDIGDIIVWEDGTRERCSSVGFEPIN